MKKILLAYFLFLLLFLSFFVSGAIDSQDGFQYMAVARNLYYEGEPTAPEYEFTGGVGVGKNIHMSTHVGKDGKTYSATGIGYSLAMLPAVAITDLVYKVVDVPPPVHFPLESDWLILLTASFTNVFFAAGIGVVVFLYLKELGIKNKPALLISFLGIITTNLFALSKHIYAHEMFTFFLLLAFYLLKLEVRVKRNYLFLLSGISWGFVLITYNTSYLLTLVPYLLYFGMLNVKKPLTTDLFKKTTTKLLIIILGTIPFFLLLNWYIDTISKISQSSLIGLTIFQSLKIPIGLFYQGIWGQLFSPGRSIFLYSPLLLIPFIFWFKIKKKVYAETIIFVLVFGIYVFSAAMAWSPNPEGYGDPLWMGESSWGPRYLTVIIPFGLLLVGYLYQKLSKIEKILTIIPLALVGLYMQTLGILMPYQIKFHNMELEFQLNGKNYPMYTYVNLLPRFSPPITMSKKLIKLVDNFPNTIDNGLYNVRFVDGIDFPFNVGPERWRVIDKDGYILFDNPEGNDIEIINLTIINHPLEDIDEPVELTMYINEKQITDSPVVIGVNETKDIKIDTNGFVFLDENNLLKVEADHPGYKGYFDKTQITALKEMTINDVPINKESIDIPFISPLGPTLTSKEYVNWGNKNDNPWLTWHIHTQVFERVPNFWWLFPVYYWDIPKAPFIILFSVLAIGVILSVMWLYKLIKKK